MQRGVVAIVVFGVLIGGAAALGPAAIALREPDEGRELPAEVPGRLVDVAGRRVHVVERGDGPPLVLVHGFGASTYDFEEHVVEPLARSHRVIAVDLLGNGWSERGDDLPYGFAFWADQLAATMDAVGVAQASLVGHSMGGAVVAVYAARHPERVDRLILADALYPRDPREAPLVFQGLRTPILGEVMLGFAADLSAPGFSAVHHARALATARIRGTRDGMLRFIRAPSLADLERAYPAITAPTLVLHGRNDTFVAYAVMERAVPAIRDARVVAHEGGHFPFRDDPGWFVEQVEAFLGTE